MNTDPTQDAHSLGIALRLAHAQIRDLSKQLAAMRDALERYRGQIDQYGKESASKALAAIKPNQGEQP